MKLIFESDKAIIYISEALSSLTNGVEICINDIQYKETENKIEILMKRKEVLEYKETFFGRTYPVYGEEIIRTLMIIKDVASLKIEVDDLLVSELNSCFTVMRGMQIKGNEIYIGSHEESQGKTLCQVFISVSKFNIEFIDK